MATRKAGPGEGKGRYGTGFDLWLPTPQSIVNMVFGNFSYVRTLLLQKYVLLITIFSRHATGTFNQVASLGVMRGRKSSLRRS